MNVLLETGLANLDARTLTHGDVRTRLSRIDTILLRYLASRPKETVSREELYANVWHYREGLHTRTLDLAMSRLRKKIEKNPQNPIHLLTVYGSGYVFIPLGEELGGLQLPSSADRQIQSNLEPEQTLFVGRTSAIEMLSELSQRKKSFTTVLGPPGTGKTRLVKHWAAQQIADQSVDSVWFCDLSDARTEFDLLQAAANGLCTPLAANEESPLVLARQLGYTIASRGEVLIILDNVEQVAEQTAKVIQQWRSQAPQAMFVLTSQVPLGLPMEQRMPLSPLPIPTDAAEDEESPAVQLFVDRAKAVKPDFAYTSDNAAEIIAIIKALDGLPLAIELAATRLHLMPPSVLREKLQQRFRLLRRHKRAGPTRHSTLHEAICWSWELLQPWEQSALAQCSVFRGGFDWDAVEAVVILDDFESAPWSVDVVAELVERSLVSVQEIGGGGARLSLLVSISVFAAEKLNAATKSAQTAVRKRHVAYYSRLGAPALLNAHLNNLRSTEVIQRQGGLALEFDNVVVAFERCLENEWSVEVEAIWRGAGAHLLMLMGSSLTIDSLLMRILELPIDPLFEANLWGHLALSKRHMGHKEKAHAFGLKALERYRELEDFAGECVTMRRLGWFHLCDGHMDKSMERLRQALEVSDKVENREAIQARIFVDIGNVYLQTGRWEQARECYETSLKAFHELGSHQLLCKTYSGMGFLYCIQGRLEESERCLNKALKIADEVDLPNVNALVLTNFGKLRMKQGRAQDAESHLSRAIALCYDRWPLLQGACQSNLALIRAKSGHISDAVALLDKAEPKIRNVHATEYGKFLCIRAEVALISGNRTAAREDIDEAETLSVGADTELGLEIHRLRGQIDAQAT